MNQPPESPGPNERERLVQAAGTAAAGTAKVVGVSILATLTVIVVLGLVAFYLLSQIF